MEVVIITQENFEFLRTELLQIGKYLEKVCSPMENFIDSKAFGKLMGVSPRTAQLWREGGKIGLFSSGE